MTTLQELLDQHAALDRQISAIRTAERSRAISDVRALMAQHGLTFADVSSAHSASHKGAAKTAGKKVAPKYRDPGTGATWTGRGLRPKWMAGRGSKLGAAFLMVGRVRGASGGRGDRLARRRRMAILTGSATWSRLANSQ